MLSNRDRHAPFGIIPRKGAFLKNIGFFGWLEAPWSGRDPPMVHVKRPERVLAGFHDFVRDGSRQDFRV
jgi:hypothetical protein